MINGFCPLIAGPCEKRLCQWFMPDRTLNEGECCIYTFVKLIEEAAQDEEKDWGNTW